jgi:predicted dehydrogenase
MKTSLRVGVVGVGYLGNFHAKKYARMEDVTLVGVVDTVGERAEEVAQRFDVPAHTDYRDLIGKVDAVSVVVPTPYHYAISRDFLENDVDVLIEKPMTRTLDEADKLIDIASTRGRIIQVGHLERFNPAVMAMEEMVDRPLFIESHRLHMFKERGTDVDVVLDLMIHDIDVILSLVKADVKSVHAVGVPVISPRVDIANARLIFDTGCVANITASRISMNQMRKIRVFGRFSYVSVDYEHRDMTVIRKAGNGMKLPIPGLTLTKRHFEEADPLEQELKAFVASVRKRETPLVSGEAGRDALRVAFNILEHIQEAKETYLAE